ncbi:Evolutionarily conserved C-terminal region 5 isoform 4 [Hibiscus syriacus]|uniref:YTH domain-containing family protein n=1 Tax=Hibiscus syriacus TaxID=106335 RepID=A0A6A2X9B8_HIBSY|nr:Evolutionarily conserved C-terminal region 5 isoform 4 [Hibiscus syriacus]
MNSLKFPSSEETVASTVVHSGQKEIEHSQNAHLLFLKLKPRPIFPKIQQKCVDLLLYKTLDVLGCQVGPIIWVTDAEEQQADPDKVEEQDAALMGHPSNGAGQSGSFVSAGERNVYSPTIYAPQPQAFYYRGYDNTAGEWDEYPPSVNAEGLELGPMVRISPSHSSVIWIQSTNAVWAIFPVTTPLPSVGGDAQLYSPQQFPFSGPPYYQHLVPPNMPYINSPSPLSGPELTTLVNVDQQGDSMLFGPRPSYPSPLGSFGRGSLPGNPGTLGFNDLQQGFDGFRSGGLWSDWSKPSDRQRPFTRISPALSPHPIGPIGQNVPMAPQQQRSFYPLGSGMNSYTRGYPQSGLNQGAGFINASVPSSGENSWGWLPFDRPRASKPKNQITAENNSSVDDNKNKPSTKINDNTFNWSDFTTDYKDAKFFIIKSYSEDNVHKSIKYGVWASTPNGNKRLDAAYDEAMEHQDNCPVNASSQFCGVAEMVGPVDFGKRVDYWQQDKWSGQFPVKLEQVLEMLSIFKSYETDMSILDDFDFYEDRQKAMQERKARQQATLMSVGVVGESEHRNAVTLFNGFIKQMSKSFAQFVCLDDGNKEGTGIERTNSASDGSKGARVKLEDVITATASSSQAS